MRENRVLCDRCKAPEAKSLDIFKDRKADGAGGMENWNYNFDLCGRCALVLLEMLIEITDNAVALKIVTEAGVKTRVG